MPIRLWVTMSQKAPKLPFKSGLGEQRLKLYYNYRLHGRGTGEQRLKLYYNYRLHGRGTGEQRLKTVL